VPGELECLAECGRSGCFLLGVADGGEQPGIDDYAWQGWSELGEVCGVVERPPVGDLAAQVVDGAGFEAAEVSDARYQGGHDGSS
jgi:hypothetical protein